MLTDKKLPRRDFLRISSAIVAGTAAAGLIPGRSLFAAADASVMLPVTSVGYAEAGPQEGEEARLRYASALSAGDPAFLSHRAKISVSDFTRFSKHRGTGSGYELDAIFPANSYTPATYPRFRSWLTMDLEGGNNAAPGARFTMPVTSTDGAQLVVRRLRANAPKDAQPEESLLSFSTGAESGSMKLLRGIYVIALRETGSDDSPNWTMQSLVRGRNGALSIPNARFSYLVVTVDYAD